MSDSQKTEELAKLLVKSLAKTLSRPPSPTNSVSPSAPLEEPQSLPPLTPPAYSKKLGNYTAPSKAALQDLAASPEKAQDTLLTEKQLKELHTKIAVLSDQLQEIKVAINKVNRNVLVVDDQTDRIKQVTREGHTSPELAWTIAIILIVACINLTVSLIHALYLERKY